MKFKEVFKTVSPEAQAEWCEWEGASFLVAPMGNTLQKKESLKMFTLNEALELEIKGPAAFGTLNANEAMSKIYGLYANSIILDWKDVEDDNGKPLKFTHKKCLEFMLEYSEFANWLIEQANIVAEKRNKVETEIEKKQ